MNDIISGWRKSNWTQRATLLLLALTAVPLLVHARLPDPMTGQERSSQFAGPLNASNVLEQSFVSTRNGLTAVEVFALVPPGQLSADHTLTLRLHKDDTPGDVGVWHLPLRQVQRQRRLVLSFPPQPHSKDRAYVLSVETTAPPDTVTLLASDEDVYPTGELRLNDVTVPRDLTFRTYTAITPALLLAGVRSVLPDYLLLLALTAFICLIGGALLVLMGYFPGSTQEDGFLWSAGVGLALVPVAYLLFGQGASWLLVALVLLASFRIMWRVFHDLVKFSLLCPSLDGAIVLLLFLWALFVRCMQIQDVPVPMWMDSLSHWQMTQTILSAGRIPSGLLYHVGYHTHAALLHTLTGLELSRVLLLLGQWISAFNGPALFVLALPVFTQCGLKHPRAAALFAAAALTCLPSLPGYLMNWGRYPFLLGLTLLPFFLSVLMAALQPPPSPKNWKKYSLFLLLLTGMMLSHYGMLTLSASFAVILLALRPPVWLRGTRPSRFVGAALLLIFLVGSIMVLRFGDNLLPRLDEMIGQSRMAQEDLRSQDMVQLLLRAGGGWLFVLGSMGAVWAFFRSRLLLWFSVGWFVTQAILTALQSPLLGFGLASYTNLLLALSIPLALLAGTLRGNDTQKAAQPSLRHLRLIVFALLFLAGGISQMGILNPAALTFSPADAAAVNWIRANTEQDARFLINSASWSTGKIVPSDGGGWITPLTSRATVFYDDTNPPSNWQDFIFKENVDYIYLGRHSGFMTRSYIASTVRYPVVYDQNGITIYSVTQRIK